MGYTLKAFKDERVKAVFDERWVPLLQDMWRHCAELWPDLAKEMLRQLKIIHIDKKTKFARGNGAREATLSCSAARTPE